MCRLLEWWLLLDTGSTSSSLAKCCLVPAARGCSSCTRNRICTCVICRAQLCVCNTLLGQAGLYYCICLFIGWEPLFVQVCWGAPQHRSANYFCFMWHFLERLSWSSSRGSIATAQLRYHGQGHPAAQRCYRAEHLVVGGSRDTSFQAMLTWAL